jgi:hypothetical protein
VRLEMPYLAPEFRYDVFVSYSQGAPDVSGDSPLKTWSQAFARELERELRISPGLKSTVIFLDGGRRPESRLASNDPLTQQVRKAATDSAFFLVLMSPHYLGSDWCRDERGWWALSHCGNLDAGSSGSTAEIRPQRRLRATSAWPMP